MSLAKPVNIVNIYRPSFTLIHTPGPIPDKYIISVQQVEKSLSKINPRKAIGPDAIPAGS